MTNKQRNRRETQVKHKVKTVKVILNLQYSVDTNKRVFVALFPQTHDDHFFSHLMNIFLFHFFEIEFNNYVFPVKKKNQ